MNDLWLFVFKKACGAHIKKLVEVIFYMLLIHHASATKSYQSLHKVTTATCQLHDRHVTVT